jgi:tRNA(fMet)-specific endonuclease VapC
MKWYMLDTNMVSYLIKGHPIATRRITTAQISSLCISAITEGELLFGLAKRPDARRLHLAVHEFLKRVDVLPWNSQAAERYGAVRASLVRQGKSLAPLDLLIATHALSIDATLITNDAAFRQVIDLRVDDWSVD